MIQNYNNNSPIASNPQDLLLKSYEVVVQKAHPSQSIADYIPSPPKGRMIVIGAGKASAAMAAAFEAHYAAPLSGLVVTRYGHSVPTKHIRIVEAAHPVPDRAGQQAVSDMIALIESADEDDLIVCLMSGGGSSLLSAPVEGISFDDIQSVNKALLASGAPIRDMNIVRKHLNRALGGGLAQAATRCKMITLAISDVTGDDPAVIASGATVADPSTLEQARSIINQYAIPVSSAVMAALDNPANETLKPDDPVLDGNEYHMIATPALSLQAAADFWQGQGIQPFIIDTEMEGDTNACAAHHCQIIRDILNGKGPVSSPCALISGGETTVTIQGNGQGGPNTQFMLQAAIELADQQGVYGLACDTDGIDGSADNAGAIITPDTLKRADAKGINPSAYLRDNNSYGFFNIINGLVKTGPTYTNVNDYRVFLLLP